MMLGELHLPRHAVCACGVCVRCTCGVRAAYVRCRCGVHAVCVQASCRVIMLGVTPLFRVRGGVGAGIAGWGSGSGVGVRVGTMARVRSGSGQEGGAPAELGLGRALVQRAQLHEDLLALLLGAAQRDNLQCVPPTRRGAVPHQLDEAGAPLAQYTDILERPEPLHTALAAGATLVGGGRRRRATWVER